MTLSHVVPEVVGEVADSIELASNINGFQLEPRCRVCRNELLRKKVNDMLATGASYAFIVRALAADNDELDPRDRVTLDSVRNHTSRHFPVQQAARATYREILERRAHEQRVDFVQAVASALTPMAFLETVMVRSYETLVDSGTEVSVDTGVRAAEKLQSILDRNDQVDEIADMRRQVGLIQDAVKAVVPQDMWGDIVARLDQVEQHPDALDVGTEDFYDDDDPYDPTEFISEDDDDEH
jgi:hypothetical protein